MVRLPVAHARIVGFQLLVLFVLFEHGLASVTWLVFGL